MIQALQRKISHEKISGIQPVRMDWQQFPPKPNYELVMACFFPDAFSPQGIQRMEAFTHDRCLLVLGAGTDAFPLRKQIWRQVMKHPRPNGGDNLLCAQNYLVAAGRQPTVDELALPVHLDADATHIQAFYLDYFAILGQTGPRLQRVIADTAAAFTRQGRIRIDGRVDLRILSWQKP